MFDLKLVDYLLYVGHLFRQLFNVGTLSLRGNIAFQSNHAVGDVVLHVPLEPVLNQHGFQVLVDARIQVRIDLFRGLKLV